MLVLMDKQGNREGCPAGDRSVWATLVVALREWTPLSPVAMTKLATHHFKAVRLLGPRPQQGEINRTLSLTT